MRKLKIPGRLSAASGVKAAPNIYSTADQTIKKALKRDANTARWLQ